MNRVHAKRGPKSIVTVTRSYWKRCQIVSQRRLNAGELPERRFEKEISVITYIKRMLSVFSRWYIDLSFLASKKIIHKVSWRCSIKRMPRSALQLRGSNWEAITWMLRTIWLRTCQTPIARHSIDCRQNGSTMVLVGTCDSASQKFRIRRPSRPNWISCCV